MKEIGTCPDNCGRKIYEIGNYRGFQLTLKPFFDGWIIKGEKIHDEDVLDQILLKTTELSVAILEGPDIDFIFSLLGKKALEDLVKSVHFNIDIFWKRKQHIVDLAKKDELQVIAK